MKLKKLSTLSAALFFTATLGSTVNVASAAEAQPTAKTAAANLQRSKA